MTRAPSARTPPCPTGGGSCARRELRACGTVRAKGLPLRSHLAHLPKACLRPSFPVAARSHRSCHRRIAARCRGRAGTRVWYRDMLSRGVEPRAGAYDLWRIVSSIAITAWRKGWAASSWDKVLGLSWRLAGGPRLSSFSSLRSSASSSIGFNISTSKKRSSAKNTARWSRHAGRRVSQLSAQGSPRRAFSTQHAPSSSRHALSCAHKPITSPTVSGCVCQESPWCFVSWQALSSTRFSTAAAISPPSSGSHCDGAPNGVRSQGTNAGLSASNKSIPTSPA